MQEIAEIARTYFQKLFEAGEKDHYEHLLIGVDWCITEEDNCRLTV